MGEMHRGYMQGCFFRENHHLLPGLAFCSVVLRFSGGRRSPQLRDLMAPQTFFLPKLPNVCDRVLPSCHFFCPFRIHRHWKPGFLFLIIFIAGYHLTHVIAGQSTFFRLSTINSAFRSCTESPAVRHQQPSWD
jgi:hypothetical protein